VFDSGAEGNNFTEEGRSEGRVEKLHNEKLHSLLSAHSIISMDKWRMRWTWQVTWGSMGTHRFLVGEPEGKRSIGSPRHRCVDNMKVYLGEIGWGGMDWIVSAQDTDKCKALLNAVMKFNFYNKLGSYRVAAQLVASRVMLSPTEVVILLL
jgi:hypothetical protein